MIVKFTKDYTGRETAMQEYKAGEQADLPTAQALALVNLGVARELWSEIGKMYDPPKMAEPTTNEVKADETSPKFAEVLVEEAPPVKKPRKGKKQSKG